MKKYLPVVAVSALVIGLAACKTAEQELVEAGGQQLSAAEAKSFLAGRTTVRHIHLYGGIDTTTYWNTDGTAGGKNSKGQSGTATWQVKADGQVCSKWTEPKWNEFPCFKLIKKNGVVQWIADGEVWADTTKNVAGNPEGL